MPVRPGIQAEGIAPSLSRQRNQPLNHRLAMPLRARRRIRHQVINIQCLPARQHVLHAKSRHRNHSAVMLQRCQLIPLRLLRLHLHYKLTLNQQRPQLTASPRKHRSISAGVTAIWIVLVSAIRATNPLSPEDA